MTLAGRHWSRRLAGAWGLAAVGLFGVRRAAAFDFSGTRLTVERTAAAASCPTEAALGAELVRRRRSTDDMQEPLWVRVLIDAENEGFSARIRVSGRKRGERTLHAAGPSCDGLRDALLVSLELILDETPESVLPALPGTEAPIAVRPAENRGTPASVWVAVGGAVTHGLPSAWSGAPFAEVVLSLGPGELTAGAFIAPEHRFELAPGSIALLMVGGRARGCYFPADPAARVRVGGCVAFLGAALRADAEGFTEDTGKTRPFWLFGAGPDLRWTLTPRLRLGLSIALLVSPHREIFTVQNVGGFATDRLAGWAGADLGLRIW